MKSLLALVLSVAASADELYPNNTIAVVHCDEATFDPTGAAASGSPTDASGCTANCKTDTFDVAADYNYTTGQVTGLATDRYAGCSFPTDYYIDETAEIQCDYNSASKGGNGFFMAVDSNSMATKDRIIYAILMTVVNTEDSPAVPWQIYKASSDSALCTTATAKEEWIIGTSVLAVSGGATDQFRVNLTDFYTANDADNGKMYIYAVPGPNTVMNENSQMHRVATMLKGPMQFGVSTSCGADKFTCVSCVPSCHWCQITVNGVTSGMCGVTEGQCYAQQSPYGTVGWYLDQCTTPESSTSSTTTTTTTSNTGTAASTITAGASSAMMLSVAGAVLLGAALTL